MSGFVGADVDELIVLAKRIELQSHKFSEIAASSTAALMVAEWTGADIDRLRSGWSRRSKPTMLRLSANLAALAFELRKQAEQQRAASTNTGTRNWAGAGPSDSGGDAAPSTTKGYIETLRGMNSKEDGVRIHRIVGEDGVTRFVVYIAGTDSAGDGTLSALNNVFAIAGEDADSRKAIEQKIRDATADCPDAEIMLVGHSQGGMLAQQIADRGEFNVKEVLTYASPVVTDRNNYGGANVVRLTHNADPINLVKLAGGGNFVQEVGGELGHFLIGDDRPPKGIERNFAGGNPFQVGDVHGGASDYSWLADQFDKSQNAKDVSARIGEQRFQGTVVEDIK